MTTENKNNMLLVFTSVLLMTIILLGSFVVSLKIENILYLTVLYWFVIFQMLETRK